MESAIPDPQSAIEFTTPSRKKRVPPLLRQGGEEDDHAASAIPNRQSVTETPAFELEYNAYGKEIWVESRNEQGKPTVWYHHDRRGRRYKNNRDTLGIYVTLVGGDRRFDTC